MFACKITLISWNDLNIISHIDELHVEPFYTWNPANRLRTLNWHCIGWLYLNDIMYESVLWILKEVVRGSKRIHWAKLFQDFVLCVKWTTTFHFLFPIGVEMVDILSWSSRRLQGRQGQGRHCVLYLLLQTIETGEELWAPTTQQGEAPRDRGPSLWSLHSWSTWRAGSPLEHGAGNTVYGTWHNAHWILQ